MTTDPAVRPHAHFGDDYSPDRCAWTGLDGTKCDVPLRQSATTTDPAVQAAAEAIHRARCCDLDHPGALSEVWFGAVALIDRALACVPMRWTG